MYVLKLLENTKHIYGHDDAWIQCSQKLRLGLSHQKFMRAHPQRFFFIFGPIIIILTIEMSRYC